MISKFPLILLNFLFATAAFADSSLTYIEEEVSLADGKAKLYSVEFDLKDHELKLSKSLDGKIGCESVVDIAKRHNAIAGINGSVFIARSGRLAGIPSWFLKVGENLYAAPIVKPVFYLGEDKVGILYSEIKPFIGYQEEEFQIASINIPSLANDMLYKRKVLPVHVITSSYSDRTLTEHNSYELVVDNNAKILLQAGGNSPIPDGGFVVTSNTEAGRELLSKWQIGDLVTYGVRYSAPELNDAEYIIAGSDTLIESGKIPRYLSKVAARNDDFLYGYHARSAICIKEDGIIGLYVAENNARGDSDMSMVELVNQLVSSGYKEKKIRKMSLEQIADSTDKLNNVDASQYRGVSLPEFAMMLKNRGCIDALNLDGGSSSAMVYDNELVNKIERHRYLDIDAKGAVGDAILLFPKPALEEKVVDASNS